MKMCNDPKCPLNRQGVPHEIHELIESRQIKNQCMDGRCAMNRMGMPHNSHDVEQISESKNRIGESSNTNFKTEYKINKLSREQVETERQRRQRLRREHEEAEIEQLTKDQEEEIERLKKVEEEDLLKRAKNAKSRSDHKQAVNQEYEPESFDDALEQIGKNIKGDYKINKLTREQIESERQRRQKVSREHEEAERKGIEQSRVHSQTISEKPTSKKPKSNSGLFSHFSPKPNIPSANQILQSHDPYVIFGLKPDTTCDEIKSKYRELSRTYFASRGIIHKSEEEKDQSNAIQRRINVANDKLRERHCG